MSYLYTNQTISDVPLINSSYVPLTSDSNFPHHPHEDDHLDSGQIWGVSIACVVTLLILLVVGGFTAYRVVKLREENKRAQMF